WSKLRHQNVLPLLGITTDFDYTISIVSEWMDKGNAHDYVQDETVDPRPLIDGIAQGLQYLHTYKTGSSIFHGDLKGANILISAEGRPLLTDFGFSYVVNSSFKISLPAPSGGTFNWMAPEKLNGDDLMPTAEGDVWSFGMTTLELFTRKVPFHEHWTYAQVMLRVMKGPLPDRPSTDDTHSRLTNDWWDLCRSCWNQEPSLRPSMPDVVKKISSFLIHESRQQMLVQRSQQLSPTTNELLNICPR
ncbi:kinase-like domain-containing protein, partial [Scleroderma citrinum]